MEVAVPETARVPVVVTFPFPNTVNRVVVERFPDVEDAIMNSGLVPARPELSWMESLAEGEVVPMPTLVEFTVRVGVAEYPTWKVEAVLLVKPRPRAKALLAEAMTFLPMAKALVAVELAL